MIHTALKVTELAIYPIKSTRKISLQQAVTVNTGFTHDRRWMLVDNDGRFITQRQHPRMVFITATPNESGLFLTAPGKPQLHVDTPESDLRSLVTVWKDDCLAIDSGDTSAQWFTDFIGVPCRLVYMDDEFKRQVDQRYAQPTDQTGFADGFPFLLTTEASLEELNGRLTDAVPMERFRPNIVINGLEAYAEDHWRRIRIGTVVFRVSKACTRCVMTTVDTDLGIKGKEPLRTLSSYRRGDKGVLFGMNLIHDTEGTISVGDSVEVLT